MTDVGVFAFDEALDGVICATCLDWVGVVVVAATVVLVVVPLPMEGAKNKLCLRPLNGVVVPPALLVPLVAFEEMDGFRRVM